MLEAIGLCCRFVVQWFGCGYSSMTPYSKRGAKICTGSFHHSQRERLRDEDGRERFPRFGDRADLYREQFFGSWMLLGCNEDDSTAAFVTVARQFHAEFRGSPQRKNYGYVRSVDVEQGPMTEACAGVSVGAIAGHFTNGQRTHDGAAVGRTAPHDLNVGRAATRIVRVRRALQILD